VSGTVRKGILQVGVYEEAELELMLGMFAALSKYHVLELVLGINVTLMRTFCM